MARQIFVDPEKVRKTGKLTFKDIPVNQYNETLESEKQNFTKSELIFLYKSMVIIREFESMLLSVRTAGEYKSISYEYTGPAHLSIGQEAAAVGQAFLLNQDDFIFGSHRSHGEIIAKGMSAIRKLADIKLAEIMESFFDGAILKVIEENLSHDSIKAKALDFFLYGVTAELFGRKKGFAKGLGNSMHAFFTPFGIYPNNAIVGGSGPIALGAALYKKVNKKKGIVVANLGDGSLGCGPVWESMNMSAMGQFKNLWPDDYKGGLPIIFNFVNNHYGMGGQTQGETMSFEALARVGAGINPEQMHAERVDGFNPLAVIDAMKRKLQLLHKGQGPVLLDVITYRYTGHSPSDAETYRTKEELQAWKRIDPIETFRKDLISTNIALKEELDDIVRTSQELILKIYKLARDERISPRMDLKKNPNLIGNLMFSNKRIEKMENRECEVLTPKADNPRIQQLKHKSRFAIKEGKPISKIKAYQIRDGIFEAVLDKFYVDPTLIAYGEDNRDWGGAFGVYRGLSESIPYHRLFNAPISEAAIVGSAVGYALSGGRAIVELMYCDFIGRAGDEIFNQLSKWQSMSAGVLNMPVVVRVSVGAKYGAQHSQDWTSICANIPGLKIVYPATPYDAKGLMNAALMSSDPVIYFESQKIYDKGELFYKRGVPEGYYELPLGEPDIKREGRDITILTIGPTLYVAMEAAEILQEKYGLSAEIIDTRSIVPFNYEKVIESVKKTGKVLLTSDACERGSILNDFATNITAMAFDYLDAPPVVIGSKNWITPTVELEEFFYPQPSWIIDAIHERIMPIHGHIAEHNFTIREQIRKNKSGI